MPGQIDLSLILTLYKEGVIVKSSLARLLELLGKSKLNFEIILIDDASPDETSFLARQATYGKENCRFYKNQKNVGRGGTVSRGIRLAKGKVVGFIDTDLEISPEKIPQAVRLILNGQADVVSGMRTYKFHPSLLFRFILSRGYHLLVRLCLPLPLKDTETGFKFFNREKILPVLAKVEDKRWFWDTEIMALSYQANLKIKEIPVLFKKRLDKKSSVKLFQDSLDYFKKLIKLRRRFGK